MYGANFSGQKLFYIFATSLRHLILKSHVKSKQHFRSKLPLNILLVQMIFQFALTCRWRKIAQNSADMYFKIGLFCKLLPYYTLPTPWNAFFSILRIFLHHSKHFYFTYEWIYAEGFLRVDRVLSLFSLKCENLFYLRLEFVTSKWFFFAQTRLLLQFTFFYKNI